MRDGEQDGRIAEGGKGASGGRAGRGRPTLTDTTTVTCGDTIF